MKQLITWFFSAVFFAAVGGLSAWLFMNRWQGEEHVEEPPAAESAEEPVLSRDQAGDVVVRMEEETQHRVGLRVEPVSAEMLRPQSVAFGSLQEDPSATFTLRAPLAGSVMAGPAPNWPKLGRQMRDGEKVGELAPRVGPIERIDLASRLASAHGDVEDAQASLEALRTSLASKQQLNAGGQKIISDQMLQEAEARFKSQEARLRAAQETVKTIEASMSGNSRTMEVLDLVLPRGGRVVEVLVQPGESVENGQSLLRISNYDRMLARVALPTGQAVPEIGVATVLLAGHEDQPLSVETGSLAASADPVTGGQTLLFEIATDGLSVQPGMPATARFDLPGEPLNGTLVPSGAIVRYVGAAWVYVQSDETHFTRHEVTLTKLTPKGWFVSEGLAPGSPVVVQAAQSLLSAELKFEAGGGGEEEE